MNNYLLLFLCWFAGISVITAFITALDKLLARKNKRRISEATLFTLAFIGGALSEYITMKTVHHKTLHKKFMIGLPVIFVFQCIIATVFIFFT